MKEILKTGEGEWWWCSGEIWFDLFGEYIRYVADEADFEYVKSCADYINTLSDATKNSLLDMSIKYCEDFTSRSGNRCLEIKKREDVLRYISSYSISIPEPMNGNEPLLYMVMDCEWEEEHGMAWVVRGEQVVYVGPYSGHSPWDYEIGRHHGSLP